MTFLKHLTHTGFISRKLPISRGSPPSVGRPGGLGMKNVNVLTAKEEAQADLRAALRGGRAASRNSSADGEPSHLSPARRKTNQKQASQNDTVQQPVVFD